MYYTSGTVYHCKPSLIGYHNSHLLYTVLTRARTHTRTHAHTRTRTHTHTHTHTRWTANFNPSLFALLPSERKLFRCCACNSDYSIRMQTINRDFYFSIFYLFSKDKEYHFSPNLKVASQFCCHQHLLQVELPTIANPHFKEKNNSYFERVAFTPAENRCDGLEQLSGDAWIVLCIAKYCKYCKAWQSKTLSIILKVTMNSENQYVWSPAITARKAKSSKLLFSNRLVAVA